MKVRLQLANGPPWWDRVLFAYFTQVACISLKITVGMVAQPLHLLISLPRERWHVMRSAYSWMGAL